MSLTATPIAEAVAAGRQAIAVDAAMVAKLTDMAGDFPGYTRVWADHFPDPAVAPCRTTLGITALPTPISIELKCVAHVPECR